MRVEGIAQKGETLRVRVGEKCKQCRWYGSFTQSCSYCDLNHKSRLLDKNGNRTNPAYCNKYEEGEPRYDKSQWGDKGVIRRKKT